MAVTITLWILLAALIGAFGWIRWRDSRAGGDANADAAPAQDPPPKTASEPGGDPQSDSRSAPKPSAARKTGGSLQAEAESLLSGTSAPVEPDASAGAGSSRRASEPARTSAAQSTAPSDSPASQRRPGAKRHWLVGATKSIKDKAFHIGERTATVGRLPNNLIQLDQGQVSRVHCQLRGSADHLQVMPMETRNGTRINGEEAQAHSLHTLSEGDVIDIGNNMLVYHEYLDQTDDGTDAKKRRGIGVEAATALLGGEAWTERIQDELRSHDGDISGAARTLGIEPDVLEHMIGQLGIDP